MKSLIKALLDYSRLHAAELTMEKVDSAQIIDEVLSDLQLEIEHSGAVFRRDDCPVLVGNPVMLRQVFQNLISNALKFHQQNVPPKITIGATRKDCAWEFTVKDNGIGVDEQYHELVFGIFKRLHTRKEYEGTGLGLALCRKIVELHGGEIYLKSTYGKGSTFFFILPDRN